MRTVRSKGDGAMQAEPIRSLQNPQVKCWASLLTKKGRDRSGAFLVEGAHLVSEALKSGMEVTDVMFVPDSPAVMEVEEAVPQETFAAVRKTAVSEQVMAKITDAQTPQGIAAVVKKREIDWKAWVNVLTDQPASYVALDAIQDPGNLGTIIRSADAAGASAVFAGRGTVDLYNPKTIRSTMGSLFHLPVISCDLAVCLPLLRSKGIRVIGTSLAAHHSCYEAPLGGAACFLLGNEGAGVSPALQALADDHVMIPMQGKAESLNVAMAATVLLFEAMRQRGVQR